MALSRGFPRVDPSTTLPFDVRTFLEGDRLRGCLICTINLARAQRLVKAWPRDSDGLHSTTVDLHRPQQTHDPAEHLDLFAANRLHRLVFGLQADVVGFA